MACVSILASDVAKIPLDVYRRLPNGGKEVFADHYLHRLLREPNNWQDGFEFKEMLQASLVLRGNGYAVAVRNGRGDAALPGADPPRPGRTVRGAVGRIFLLRHAERSARDGDAAGPAAADPVVRHAAPALAADVEFAARVIAARAGAAVDRRCRSGWRNIRRGSSARVPVPAACSRPIRSSPTRRSASSFARNGSGCRPARSNSGATAILEQGLKWQPLGPVDGGQPVHRSRASSSCATSPARSTCRRTSWRSRARPKARRWCRWASNI